jgi:hypothetical protein
MIQPGETAASVRARTSAAATYVLDTAAGRYLALCFLPPDQGRFASAWSLIAARRELFDDAKIAFFGVLPNAANEDSAVEQIPGVRWFLDYDRRVAADYGLALDWCGWVVIEPSFRVLAIAPLDQTRQLLDALAALPAPELHAGAPLWAPVLITPRIFEPELCRRLIEAYANDGGRPSGFMREVDGVTVALHDREHKVRSDHHLTDEILLKAARTRLARRLAPQIEKAFAFKATRVERDIVACYDAAEGGFFRAHRDNTTAGTAHRRFAVTINLNGEDYEGGDLVFPEFGSRTYRAPTGGAVAFSCSLLHAALPVTKGKRYAYLPFLYDEAAAQVREANLARVSPEFQNYSV